MPSVNDMIALRSRVYDGASRQEKNTWYFYASKLLACVSTSEWFKINNQITSTMRLHITASDEAFVLRQYELKLQDWISEDKTQDQTVVETKVSRTTYHKFAGNGRLYDLYDMIVRARKDSTSKEGEDGLSALCIEKGGATQKKVVALEQGIQDDDAEKPAERTVPMDWPEDATHPTVEV